MGCKGYGGLVDSISAFHKRKGDVERLMFAKKKHDKRKKKQNVAIQLLAITMLSTKSTPSQCMSRLFKLYFMHFILDLLHAADCFHRTF